MREPVSKRLALAAVASALLFACATAGDDNSSSSDIPTDDSGGGGGGDGSQVADSSLALPDTSPDNSAANDSTAPEGGGIDVLPNDAGTDSTSSGDGSTCVTVTTGTGANDGGTCPAPVNGTCGMGSLSGFTPTWIPPSGYHQGKCTLAEIQTVFDDCWGTNADPIACANDQGSGCYACLVTEELGSSAYGPLIATQNDALVNINVAGCLALLEPCNQACATAIADDFACDNAACEANCPVNSQTSYNRYVACEATADGCKTGCDTYATEATQCTSQILGAQHPGSICMSANHQAFTDYYAAVAPVFCGP
jgi:hypothetical protein